MSYEVSFTELAQQLNVDSVTVRRLIERYGSRLKISIKKEQSKTSNANYLSRDDAQLLVTYYESLRSSITENSMVEAAIRDYGVFYVIQLVPEVIPDRIKIGYTDNLEKHLVEHRIAAPTARVLGLWPCKREWDYTAIESITREGCALVLNEVFEGEPDGFVRRAEAFFELMPKPDIERTLSDHSPLKASS